MKKLLLAFIMVLLFAGTTLAQGPYLQWDVLSGQPDSYVLYYRQLNAPAWTVQAFGNGSEREYDLAQINPSLGVRYEMFLIAMLAQSESAPTDILRYTFPVPQQIIEIPEKQPVIIHINIGKQ